MRFRNIWLREIPSRFANTTHSVLAGKEADVMAVRRATAAKLFAKLDQSRITADGVNDALEVISYYREEAYVAALRKMYKAYLDKVAKMTPDQLKAEKGAYLSLRRASDQAVKCGVCPKDCPLNKALADFCKKQKW